MGVASTRAARELGPLEYQHRDCKVPQALTQSCKKHCDDHHLSDCSREMYKALLKLESDRSVHKMCTEINCLHQIILFFRVLVFGALAQTI